ncbi:hypothetical protein AX15_000692 [Amanita polypyramis BW_CC]|nr:hypothetical protein AX15_000692 [Amanita polypyramis BW_CC]
MPLLIADDSIDTKTLTKDPDRFIVFYSSIVNGQMWCPDCQGVEQVVQETFNKPDGPSALIVYVGDRNQFRLWKSLSNVYRALPWNIQSVPTIVKVKGGKEEGRLVLDEIKEKLNSFVE